MHIVQKWQKAKFCMLTLHRNLQRFCILALQIICWQPMYNIISKFFLLRFACGHVSHFCILHFAYILFTYFPRADGFASSQSVNCLKLLAIGRV